MAPKAEEEEEEAARRGAKKHGCTIESRFAASSSSLVASSSQPRPYTRQPGEPREPAVERIVTGINASRPEGSRISYLVPSAPRPSFDFVLYANRPFNEINAAREVN